ncbi:hypothetical protein HDU97_001397 [Phlyctochytrium planicorne]|nr:hypothetical protein HDU97_001397 [Phlyctochytrium planicorne]
MPSARRRAVLNARKQNKTGQNPACLYPKQTPKPAPSVVPVKPEQLEIVEALVAEPTKINVPAQMTPVESTVTPLVENITASSSIQPAFTNPTNPIESQVHSTPSPLMSRNRIKKLKAKAKREAQHAAENSMINTVHVTACEKSNVGKCACDEIGVIAESEIPAKCEKNEMVVKAQVGLKLEATEDSVEKQLQEAAPEEPALQVDSELAMESPGASTNEKEAAPEKKKAPAATNEDGEVGPNSEEIETAPEIQTAKTVLREDSGKALDDGFKKNEEVSVEKCVEDVDEGSGVVTKVIEVKVNANDTVTSEAPQPSLYMKPALMPVDGTQPTQLVFQHRPIDPIYLAYLQSKYPTLSLHQLQVFGDYVCPGCPYDHEHDCDKTLRVPPGRTIQFRVMTAPVPEILIHVCPSTPRNHVDPAWPIPVEHHDFFKNLHEVEANGQVVGMCTGPVNMVPKRYLKELFKSPLHGQTVVDDILEFNGEPKMDQKSQVVVEEEKIKEESVEMVCSESCAADHSCQDVYPPQFQMVDVYNHQYAPQWFQYGQQPINASFCASQPPAGLRPLCSYRELCTIEGCQQFHPRKPCRFFPKNCRNGDKCMYMHPPQNAQMQPCYANSAPGYDTYGYSFSYPVCNGPAHIHHTQGYPQQPQGQWTVAPTYHHRNAAPFVQPNHQVNSVMNPPQHPTQASAIPLPASTHTQYAGKTLCSLREECTMVKCPLFHPRKLCNFFPNCKNGKKCLYKHTAAAEPVAAN